MHNLLTDERYSFKVSNTPYNQTTADTQAGQMKTFLGGDSYNWASIVDTSNHFDYILNSANFNNIINMFTAACQADPAKKMNFKTSDGVQYKSKYYKEVAPTSIIDGKPEIKYITYPEYDESNHKNKISFLYCKYPVVLELLPDTNTETNKGSLLVQITYIKGGQTVRVATGDNTAGCIAQILKSLKRALKISEKDFFYEKSFLSKAVADGTQGRDRDRNVILKNPAQGLNPVLIESKTRKILKVSIDYNFHSMSLSSGDDAALIYSMRGGRQVLLKNTNLNNPQVQYTTLYNAIQAESIIIQKEIDDFNTHREDILTKTRSFYDKISELLNPDNYTVTATESVYAKQERYISCLQNGLKVMALLPFVPKIQIITTTTLDESGNVVLDAEGNPVVTESEYILPEYTLQKFTTDYGALIAQQNVAGLTYTQKINILNNIKSYFAKIRDEFLRIPAMYFTRPVLKANGELEDVYLEKQILIHLVEGARLEYKKKFTDIWNGVNIEIDLKSKPSSTFCKIGTRFTTYWCLELVKNTYISLKGFHKSMAINYIQCLYSSISGSLSKELKGDSLETKFKHGIRLLNILENTPQIGAQVQQANSEWFTVFGEEIQDGGALTMYQYPSSPIIENIPYKQEKGPIYLIDIENPQPQSFTKEIALDEPEENPFSIESSPLLQMSGIPLPSKSLLPIPSGIISLKEQSPIPVSRLPPSTNAPIFPITKNSTSKKSLSSKKKSRQTRKTISNRVIDEKLTNMGVYHINTRIKLPDIKINKKQIMESFINEEEKLNRFTKKQEKMIMDELNYFEYMINDINDIYTLVRIFRKLALFIDKENDERNIKVLIGGLSDIFISNSQSKSPSSKSKSPASKSKSATTKGQQGGSRYASTRYDLIQQHLGHEYDYTVSPGTLEIEETPTQSVVYFPVSLINSYILILQGYVEQISYLNNLRKSSIQKHIDEIHEKILNTVAIIHSLNTSIYADVDFTTLLDSSNVFSNIENYISAVPSAEHTWLRNRNRSRNRYERRNRDNERRGRERERRGRGRYNSDDNNGSRIRYLSSAVRPITGISSYHSTAAGMGARGTERGRTMTSTVGRRRSISGTRRRNIITNRTESPARVHIYNRPRYGGGKDSWKHQTYKKLKA